MAEIGFIGMGNMGLAILHGLLRPVSREDLFLRQLMQKRWLRLQKATGASCRVQPGLRAELQISDPCG